MVVSKMNESFLSIKTISSDFILPLSHSTRNYKLIILPNGLKTFLISDPISSAASASLCVATGSQNDPPDILGLSHLCEHMLFTGTKEFPDPNIYQDLINSSGGQTNAYTTSEKTCFYFEIPSSSSKNIKDESYEFELIFDQLLHIFASFFKVPLFDEGYIQDEILSVNDEHNANVGSSDKIFYHAMRLLSHKNHPFSKFGTGNIRTLLNNTKVKNINLRKELISYFKAYYIPENMSLVLRAPQSLNFLQKLALKNFNNIPTDIALDQEKISIFPNFVTARRNKHTSNRHSANSCSSDYSSSSLLNVRSTSLEYSRNSFNEIELKQNIVDKCLFIKSDIDSRLRIVFPNLSQDQELPHIEQYKRAWVNLLGDESEGSLCEHLIRYENFASSIFAFSQTLTQNESVIILDIKLTKLGEKNIESILISVLRYIHKAILTAPIERAAIYLSEMAMAEKVNYIYLDIHSSPMDETSGFSERLHEEMNPKHFVKGFKILGERDVDYDGGDFTQNPGWWINEAEIFLKASSNVLAASNFGFIMMSLSDSTAKFLNGGSQYGLSHGVDEFERDIYFDFDYKFFSMAPLSLRSKIKDFSTTRCSMHIPDSNIFLNQYKSKALDDNLLASSDESLGFKVFNNSANSTEMELVDYSKLHELWFQKEAEGCGLQKIAATFKIQCLTLEPSAKNSVTIEIICGIIGESLRYKLYQAELIGFRWGIFPGINSTSSIIVTLNGYRPGFVMVLQTIINELISGLQNMLITSYSCLKKERMSIRKKYKHILELSGFEKVIAGTYMFLEEKVWPVEDRIDEVEMSDIDDLVSVSKKILMDIKFTSILINGNIEDDRVMEISHIINRLSNHEKVLNYKVKCNINEPSSYLLPDGKNYEVAAMSPKNDPVNIIFYYMQIGMRDSAFDRVMSSLLVYILSLNVFKELRTNRKLGYSVFSGLRLFRKTIGIHISIISGTFKPEFLKEQIEDFLFELELKLINYSDDEFYKIILQPFMNSLDEQQSEVESSTSLLSTLEPIKGSSSPLEGESYTIHRNLLEKVINRTYRFESRSVEQDIDKNIIKGLSKNSFYDYFKRKVSIKSPLKSSLSIMFESQVDQSETEKIFFKDHVKLYLQEKENLLDESDLELLYTKCKSDYALLPHEIFKILRRKKVGSKFFKTAASDISKSFVASLIHHKHSDSSSRTTNKKDNTDYVSRISAIPVTKIGSADELHRECQIAARNTHKLIHHWLEEIDLFNQEDSSYLQVFDI